MEAWVAPGMTQPRRDCLSEVGTETIGLRIREIECDPYKLRFEGGKTRVSIGVMLLSMSRCGSMSQVFFF